MLILKNVHRLLNAEYNLVGIYWKNTNHYVCYVRIDDAWYRMNNLVKAHGNFVKIHDFTQPPYTGKGFYLRAWVFVKVSHTSEAYIQKFSRHICPQQTWLHTEQRGGLLNITREVRAFRYPASLLAEHKDRLAKEK